MTPRIFAGSEGGMSPDCLPSRTSDCQTLFRWKTIWREGRGRGLGPGRDEGSCESAGSSTAADGVPTTSRRSGSASASISAGRLVAAAVVVLPVVLSAVCYVNSLGGDFVHDDLSAIAGNPDALGVTPAWRLLGNDFWGKPMSDPTSHKSYRPVTVLTFRLNSLVGGEDTFGFHCVNIFLHATNTYIFVDVLRTTLGATTSVSLVAATIFAVHPIHTEAVAGIVGRADSLACCFFLLSFLFYHRFKASGRRSSLAASLACSVVSMLSKEHGITVLGVIALQELFAIKCGPAVPDPRRINQQQHGNERGRTFKSDRKSSSSSGAISNNNNNNHDDEDDDVAKNQRCRPPCCGRPSSPSSPPPPPPSSSLWTHHHHNQRIPNSCACPGFGGGGARLRVQHRNHGHRTSGSSRETAAAAGDPKSGSLRTVVSGCRSSFEKMAPIILTLVGSLAFRFWILSGSLPQFSDQDNPAAFHPKSETRLLTFAYLVTHNVWLLLCPLTLSYDWQFESIPMVRSAWDPRNVATAALAFAGAAVAGRCLTSAWLWKRRPCCRPRHQHHTIGQHQHQMRRNNNNNSNDGQQQHRHSGQRHACCPQAATSAAAAADDRWTGDGFRERGASVRVSASASSSSSSASTSSSGSPKQPRPAELGAVHNPVHQQRRPAGGHPSQMGSSRAGNSSSLARRRLVQIWTGLLFMTIPFLPASNLFFPVGFVVAERILYIPSVGFCLLVAVGWDLVLEVVPDFVARRSCPPSGTKDAVGRSRYVLVRRAVVGAWWSLFALLVAAFAVRTVVRNEDWRTRETLFRSGLSAVPHNAKMHYNFANLQLDIGNPHSAEQHYREAIRLWPTYASAHNNLGTLLNDSKDAQDEFLEALRYHPGHVNALFNLASLKVDAGELEMAITLLRHVVELDSDYAEAESLLNDITISRQQQQLQRRRRQQQRRPTATREQSATSASETGPSSSSSPSAVTTAARRHDDDGADVGRVAARNFSRPSSPPPSYSSFAPSQTSTAGRRDVDPADALSAAGIDADGLWVTVGDGDDAESKSPRESTSETRDDDRRRVARRKRDERVVVGDVKSKISTQDEKTAENVEISVRGNGTNTSVVIRSVPHRHHEHPPSSSSPPSPIAKRRFVNRTSKERTSSTVVGGLPGPDEVVSSPDDAQFYIDQGMASLSERDFKEACKLFKAALALVPSGSVVVKASSEVSPEPVDIICESRHPRSVR